MYLYQKISIPDNFFCKFKTVTLVRDFFFIGYQDGNTVNKSPAIQHKFVFPYIFIRKCSSISDNGMIERFFETRPDGSTMHPSRYDDYPKLIMIGYGDKLSSDDAQLFTDIIKKHRTSVEVLIFRDSDSDIVESLNKINLKRESGML